MNDKNQKGNEADHGQR